MCLACAVAEGPVYKKQEQADYSQQDYNNSTYGG